MGGARGSRLIQNTKGPTEAAVEPVGGTALCCVLYTRDVILTTIARATWVDFPGAWYLVLNRGIETRTLFRVRRFAEHLKKDRALPSKLSVVQKTLHSPLEPLLFLAFIVTTPHSRYKIRRSFQCLSRLSHSPKGAEQDHCLDKKTPFICVMYNEGSALQFHSGYSFELFFCSNLAPSGRDKSQRI